MLRSIGILVYFFMAQILSCAGLFTFKACTDYEWLARVYDAAVMGDIFSAEYLSLLNEILYPALILSDALIVLPVILKRKEPLCRKVSIGSLLYYICSGAVLNVIVSVAVSVLPTENYDSLMAAVLTGSPALIFIVSGVLAPIVEEIVFRHVMLNALEKRYNPQFALFMSSLLFGLAHMNIVQSAYAFILGIVLGRIYQKDRNLLPSIIVHLTINASSILYEYSSGNVRIALLVGVGIESFFIFKRAKRKFMAENMQEKKVW